MSTHKLSSILKYPLEIKFNTEKENFKYSLGNEKEIVSSDGIMSKLKDPMILYGGCLLLPILILYISKPSFIMSTVDSDKICKKKLILWSFIISSILCSLLYFESAI
jgi:hypothetical protein